MRLDRFICKSTHYNRSDATALINKGVVVVNGDVTTNEAKQVHESNCITLEGQILTPRPSRYIMIHKPLDMICSNVDEGYPSIFRLIDVDRVYDLHIAGRLDTDTTGLVLVTDDGRWSYNIITPKKRCEKVYRVGLRDPIAADVAARFQEGVQLQGEASLTRPAKLEILTSKEVLLTITEGKFHQVKRMFAAVGNRVVSLHRQKIGEINLDVTIGQWRYLTADEIMYFK
ncbi:pseudouridine synthase [Alkalimarinus sediminis]|uniref:Pseudouridine synthase n=1 Tax=Alkalimarinus sediminis TaxID=1632866 RepID=A0A9E8HJE0_9ALTE|nr:pseudouridine synthase [Alkalimarinus sediminis]UZW73788.1 pseudouridine synthase [Alkalimarinus sediminis]